MHRIFYIAELILEVADYLHVQDTLHLGLTCKALWQVAGVSVWRGIVDGRAIRGLLPEDVDVRLISANEYLPSRPMEETDWAPLVKYGQHIRHLSFEDEEDAAEILSALTILATYPDAKEEALPNLKSVFFRFVLNRTIPACAPFFRRPFTRLSVSVDWGHFSTLRRPTVDTIIGLLHVIECNCQNLEYLTFMVENAALNDGPSAHWNKMCGTLEPFVASTVSQLPCLKAVTFHILSEGHLILPILGQLQTLERLELDVVDFSHSEPFHLPPCAFPSLKELTIPYCANSPCLPHGANPISLVCLEKLLSAITSTSLSSLEFFTDCPSLGALQDVMQLIAKKWTSTFTSLKLFLELEPQILLGPVNIPLETFKPLALCTSLRVVEIGSRYPLDLSDHHFDFMSRAWPHLRRFCVKEVWVVAEPYPRPEGWAPWTPLATRRSLAFFAARCPALEFLSIPVNFDLDSGSWNVTKDGPSLSRLKTFAVNLTSECSSPDDAARFLLATFPHASVERTQFLLQFMITGDYYSQNEESMRGQEEWNNESEEEDWVEESGDREDDDSDFSSTSE